MKNLKSMVLTGLLMAPMTAQAANVFSVNAVDVKVNSPTEFKVKLKADALRQGSVRQTGLSDAEMDQVEGKGLAGAALGFVAGGVLGGLTAGVSTAVADYVTKGSVDWSNVRYNTVAGATAGAIPGAIKGAFIPF